MPVTEELVARTKTLLASWGMTVDDHYLMQNCRRSLAFLEIGPAALEMELEHAARVTVAVEAVADLLRTGREPEEIITLVPAEQLALVKQILPSAR